MDAYVLRQHSTLVLLDQELAGNQWRYGSEGITAQEKTAC